MSKIRFTKKKLSDYQSKGTHSFELCQFLYFKRIIWSKNDRAFTSVPDSASASRIYKEDAPNPWVCLEEIVLLGLLLS